MSDFKVKLVLNIIDINKIKQSPTTASKT